MEKAKTRGVKDVIENSAENNEKDEYMKKAVTDGTSGAAEASADSKSCRKPRCCGKKKIKDMD